MSQPACALPSPLPLSLPGGQRLLRAGPMLVLLAYAGILFFHGLGDRDLGSSHEARAAQNAQTILTDGDWLLPRLFDRHVELQKPPLFYWLVGAVAWLRGGLVDAWSVRLPSACAALATVLWVRFLGLRCGRPLAGLLAALVLATCLHFTWLARVGRVDMPLTCALAFALGCFELSARAGHRRSQLLWAWAGYTALAAGVLLKGPLALVLAGVVSVANATLRRTRLAPVPAAGDASARAVTLWWGVPWLLLLTVPWFVWIDARTGGRLWDVFFWHHNVERGLGGSETLAAHGWWFYGPRTGVDLLPWVVLVPVALWWHFRAPRDPEARTGLLWFASIFAFLSCMSFKRADYLLPAYPGLAIFLGCVGEDLWRRRPQWRRHLGLAAGALLAGYAACWCGYTLAAAPEQEDSCRRVARALRARTAAPVIFFRAEAHLLAFHVGPPLDTILEWENLQVWAEQDFPVYVVMPEACVRELPQRLPGVALERVLQTTDRSAGGHDQPLVVMRSRGNTPCVQD